MTNPEKIRNGFEYIDLNRSDITPPYRPHPASAPLEIYVARIERREPEWVTEARDLYEERERYGVAFEYNSIDKLVCESETYTTVVAVYRLISQRNPRTRIKELVRRKTDGKNLATKLRDDSPITIKMKKFYDDKEESSEEIDKMLKDINED